jgi:outer membrane protein assembly factor BamB
MNRSLLGLAIGVGTLFSGLAMVRAADWTQWGGNDARNQVSPEKHLPESFVPGEKSAKGGGIDLATTQNVRWVQRLGSQTYGNPTVANGRVFVGTNDCYVNDPRYPETRGGLVKCFRESDGELLWQLPVPMLELKKKNFNFDNMDLGICSSPTVDGDRLYLVGNRCDVLCLSVAGMAHGNQGSFQDEGKYTVAQDKPPVKVGPRDGDILWRFDMLNDLPVWPQDAANCSILVHGDFLYVCTSNGVDKTHDFVPCPLAPSLIVLDKRTGKLVGQDDEKIGTRLFHGLWSNPSLGVVSGKPQIYYGGGEGICYAFAPLEKAGPQVAKLQKIWSCDCVPEEYKTQNGQRVKYRDGDIRRKKGNTGDGSFIGPSEIIATPVFYKNRVYVAIGQDPSHGRGKGALTCMDATRTGDITKTGKLWTYTDMDRSISSVSIADGLLYIGDISGRVHCLDAETGKRIWVQELKAQIWGSTFVADGKIYIGTQKALWVLAAGREPKVLSEIHLGCPVYATAITANGVLYITAHRYIWALQEGKKASALAAAK